MSRCVKSKYSGSDGYSLLELVATLSVLAILVMGTIPMAQNAVIRQKELRLREELRQMRNAIDEFKRDTVGSCLGGPENQTNPVPSDPRSRVVINDCKIFNTDNMDRYPPTLQMLVDGVKVKARGVNLTSGSGISGDSTQATELNQNKELKKVYLRELPIDPFTGKSDWKMRSSYQAADAGSWDEINVFDLRSASDDEGLNGEKYSTW